MPATSFERCSAMTASPSEPSMPAFSNVQHRGTFADAAD
jgi:hypothetical protein